MKTIVEIDQCIEDAKRKLEDTYKEHVDSVEQFVGHHYGSNSAKKAIPTNLIELAVTIYERLLAARTPRCTISTEYPDLKAFAANFEIAINQLPAEIGLGDTIRRAVKSALFTMGVVKIGIAGTDPRPNIGDEPFVSLVNIDDYFVDMSARSWDEIQFEGNEYWMDADTIAKVYGVTLVGDDYSGDSPSGVRQANAISSGEARDPLHERVLLRDVYLVRENTMLTYAVHSKKEIRRISWDGPEGTPYVKLWFSDVPGNLMPLPPVAVWKDLHILANQIYRKLSKQAVSKKNLAGVLGGDDEEVTRIKNAADGAAVRVGGAKIEKIDIGGIDNGNLAFFLQNRDLFSLLAGNLDSLGGLSSQADTATQDKLINESASARVKAMADRTIDFSRAIFKRLAWYVWTDPVRHRKFRKYASKEFNVGVNVEWTPDTRDGDFLDYNFDIAVFSMQDDSPSIRIQKLTNAFNTFIMPLVPLFQQLGVYIDVKALTDYIAKNANLPVLADMVKFADPAVMGDVPQPTATAQPSYVSTKSPVTKRVYERINRPGSMSERGKNAVLSQILLGGKPQEADIAGLNVGRAQ